MYRLSFFLIFVVLFSFSCSEKKIRSSESTGEFRFMALPDSVLPEVENSDIAGPDNKPPYEYKVLNAQFIGSLSFKKVGDGQDVHLNLRPPNSGGKLRLMPGFIIRSEVIESYYPNRLSFFRVTFPFYAYLKYDIEVDDGIMVFRSTIELEIEINEPGEWRVNIYH